MGQMSLARRHRKAYFSLFRCVCVCVCLWYNFCFCDHHVVWNTALETGCYLPLSNEPLALTLTFLFGKNNPVSAVCLVAQSPESDLSSAQQGPSQVGGTLDIKDSGFCVGGLSGTLDEVMDHSGDVGVTNRYNVVWPLLRTRRHMCPLF